MLEVYLEVYVVFMVLRGVLTHREYAVVEGGGESETPDTTVEPSGGVVGLIQ